MSRRAHQPINGQVITITGAARGIGLATAQVLASAGASVAVADVDADALEAARTELGDRAFVAHVDVTDPDSYAQFIDSVRTELGPVDVLINNAGIMPLGPLHEQSDQQVRRIFDINTMGCITGMRLVLPDMLQRGSGQIINVASAAGKSPVPGAACYGASKAAVIAITETARVEYRGTGINFTCVMPSFTDTGLISGTRGTKLIPTQTPDAVATAIAAAVTHHQPDVYVPGAAGVFLRAQPFVGRRVRDALARAMGADRTFLDVDSAARAGYEARITGPSADHAATPPAQPPTSPAARR